MKAMRKAMKWTLGDLARKLDGKTAPETVSRWESEAQAAGIYAEKVLRLIVCEQLKKDAPGIAYDA
jgi:DNA-binding transcriptional regulator YiaG